MTEPVAGRSVALGRPAVTSRAELEQISLAMFSEQGFDVTSVDEIAAAAGIGRRTFFRYFKSKNDAVWGDFDTQLESFAAWFDHCPAECRWWRPSARPSSTSIRSTPRPPRRCATG